MSKALFAALVASDAGFGCSAAIAWVASAMATISEHVMPATLRAFELLEKKCPDVISNLIAMLLLVGKGAIKPYARLDKRRRFLARSKF
ncbi:hypothetical protein IIE18_03315 [Pseudomonas sp. V1]|uniref:hypothetical protein n=1 Tax=Pseudomonas arcuscaelestis TaxID=2710591 RepID=UPI00193F4062|nr:hypothetical protein [Pseudomonas arcuscaelestis]MBM3104145.1 hypothetical protein [Pseudomonas arcuscaelestis]